MLVVTSGDRRVDEKKVSALVGKIGRADADFVKAQTGFTIGTTAGASTGGATAGAFANVSNGGGSPYSLASGDWWSFVLYGNRVIGSNYANTPQSFVIGTSAAFADLSADAPRAKHLAVVRDFIVAGNIIGRGANAATIGTAEDAIQWSALDDPTTWPAVGQRNS